jgi:hypothetical protein
MIISNGSVSTLAGDLLTIEFRRDGDLKEFLLQDAKRILGRLAVKAALVRALSVLMTL